MGEIVSLQKCLSSNIAWIISSTTGTNLPKRALVPLTKIPFLHTRLVFVPFLLFSLQIDSLLIAFLIFPQKKIEFPIGNLNHITALLCWKYIQITTIEVLDVWMYLQIDLVAPLHRRFLIVIVILIYLWSQTFFLHWESNFVSPYCMPTDTKTHFKI